MRKLPLLFALLLLVGCDHHKTSSQAQAEAGTAAVAQDDSSVTGQLPSKSSPEKSYPKAKPIESLSESAPPDNTPPPASESSKPDTASTAVETPGMTASTAPVETTLPLPSTATAPEKETEQSQVVVLHTTMGTMVIELDDFAAPKSCENFRKLVSDGFYNHTIFHRVIPNFMIQGGDPNSKSDNRASYGQGGPGYTLPSEIKLKHARGAVAMARLPDAVNPQRESNGSQFYICVAPCPSLDDQYTVFGHVIKGMDVAINIANQARDKRDDPLNRIEMEASLELKDKALAENSATNQ